MLYIILLLLTGASSYASNGSVYTFNRQKVVEGNSYLSNSLNSIMNSYSKAMTEIKREEARIQKEMQEKKDIKLSKKEEERINNDLKALYEKYNAVNQDIKMKNDIFNSELRKKIVSSLTSISGPVLDDSMVLYGSKDITSYIKSLLDDSPMQIESLNSNIKIGYIDMDKFRSESKRMVRLTSESMKRMEEFNKKREEIISNAQDADEDGLRRAELELSRITQELKSYEEISTEAVLMGLKRAATRAAIEKGFDVVVLSSAAFSDNMEDLTKIVVENYDSTQEDKKYEYKNKKSSYISLEEIMNNYSEALSFAEKYRSLEEGIKSTLSEKHEKLVEMRESGKSSDNEIAAYENDILVEREKKTQEIYSFVNKEQERILNNIKISASKVAKKLGFELVLTDSGSSSEILFGGQDITNEVLEELSR